MSGSDLLGQLIEGVCAAANTHLPTASFEGVNPRGRVDYLASRLIDKVVAENAPGLTVLHQKLKPVIDGALVKYVPTAKKGLKGLLK